jgi:S1-C subfamily serine protease
MKTKLLLVSLFLSSCILGLSGIGSGGDLDYSSLLRLISPAVVSVQGLIDPEEGLWVSASGFIIEPTGKVITACHAVLNVAKVTVQLQDGSSYEANVERCSDDDLEAKMLDVAILQLQGVSHYLPQLWLGDSSAVHLGGGVLVLSHPGPYGEFNVVTGEISGRLSRQYLILENRVYRAALLVRLERRPDGYHTGAALDLDSSHPSLKDVIAFAEKDTLIIAVERPREDELFCGMVSSIDAPRQALVVDEIDCEWLFEGWIRKTGRTAKLDREVEFLKTSAPISDGSSGGPVLNLSGQVIGVVSWGRSIEIEEDWLGYIEAIHLWAGTNYIVPSDLIRTLLGDN